MSEPEIDEVVESAVATAAGTGSASAAAAAIAAAAVAEKESNERVKQLSDKMVDLEAQLQESKTNYESIKEANSAINVELTVAQEQLCESLKLLDEKCRMLEEIEVQKIKSLAAENETKKNPSTPPPEDNNEKDLEIAKLSDEKEQICSEDELSQAHNTTLLQMIE